MCQEVSEPKYFLVVFFFLPPSCYIRVPDGRCGWVVVARFLEGKKKFLGTELPLPSKSNRTVKAAAVDCRPDKGRQRACGMQLLCLNTSQTIEFNLWLSRMKYFFVSTSGWIDVDSPVSDQSIADRLIRMSRVKHSFTLRSFTGPST
jgi:hypothetical protein